MTGSKSMDVHSAMQLPPQERTQVLIQIGRHLANGGNGVDPADRDALVRGLTTLVEEGVGDTADRLALGEVLGLLGDPRIATPENAAYWVAVPLPRDAGTIQIGRFPVTNAEFQAFVDAGGYDDRTLWTEDGLAWLDDTEDPWPVRAKAESSRPFTYPNQPVVGVTWYEAMAFARFHNARLPRFDERLWVTRGAEKRPYPWGSPFGNGNANTREEVVNRPCAVGLFIHDRTPLGVRDLAGNAAEWNLDGVGDQKWIHPGAWDQPSMAAWAKARFLEAPDSRWAGLGFRLARD